ncbi:MAG: type I methionyl aminopeptidase [Bdellovibrio sp.]|jgi:methionyl aminopeptidase
MIATTPEEVQKLREIGRIVARCLQMMKESAKPGMSLLELDALAAQFLNDFGARSAPILTYDFPGTTCLSIAPVVAHGVPNSQILQDGDLLNIDVSAEKEGYFGDTGGSFYVGTTDPEGERLLKATKEALQEAMKAAKAGAKLNKIGQRIESVADRYRYSIIENLGSHGVGKSLHEEPKFIAGFYDPDDKRILKKGQVITIEPFLSTASCFVDEMPDGWSLMADEGGLSAQFEHTLVITDSFPLIMTDPA